MNYRKSEGISPNIAAGFGNPAGGVNAEQSNVVWSIFDPGGVASPGNGGNLLQPSRKTMAPVIHHPREDATEYRASYLLARVDSCKVTIIDEKQKGSQGRALLPVCSWSLIKADLMPGNLSLQKRESTNVYTNASNQIYVLARKWRKKWLPNRGKKVLVLTQKERPSLMNKT